MIRDNGFARAPMAQGWTAQTGRPLQKRADDPACAPPARARAALSSAWQRYGRLAVATRGCPKASAQGKRSPERVRQPCISRLQWGKKDERHRPAVRAPVRAGRSPLPARSLPAPFPFPPAVLRTRAMVRAPQATKAPPRALPGSNPRRLRVPLSTPMPPAARTGRRSTCPTPTTAT